MMMRALLLVFVGVALSKLTVHEWGTFTSCQGSNGVDQSGLHHGEEALPGFVSLRVDKSYVDRLRRERGTVADKLNQETQLRGEHSMEMIQKRGALPPPVAGPADPNNCGFCKVLDFDPAGKGKLAVTQKLETPVLYFYTPEPMDLTVEVDFPKGIFTETYPAPQKMSPSMGQVESVSDGTASWEVSLTKQGERIPVPSVPNDSIWAPSRHVSASFVSSINEKTKQSENEHHIFYRGLGQFSSPLVVTSTDSLVVAANNGEETIPQAILLVTDGSFGIVRELGPISPGQSVSSALDAEGLLHPGSFEAEKLEMPNYVAKASVLLEVALTKAGLLPLESRAMVETWTKSYFHAPGVRVLYIAGHSTPDQMLPIRFKQQGQEIRPNLERVLVGRVEILLSREESKLRTLMTDYLEGRISISHPEFRRVVKKMDRFAEPKLRAALNLREDSPHHAAFESFVAEHLLHPQEFGNH